MVELVMAIAVTAIVVAVGTNSFVDYRKEARIAATQKKLIELRLAVRGDPTLITQGKYTRPGIIVDIGEVPASIDILVTNTTYPVYSQTEQRGWRGPYVNAAAGWNLDAWGNALVLESDGNVVSAGADELPGTADDIESDSLFSESASSGSSSS